MISSIRLFIIVVGTSIVLSGCTFTFGQETDAVAKQSDTIPVGTVKPDIDYSSEAPGCEVAAQRIADNLQIGMQLEDVTRLVGQPRLILPGVWLWTRAVSSSGRPKVRFVIGTSKVSSFSAENDEC